MKLPVTFPGRKCLDCLIKLEDVPFQFQTRLRKIQRVLIKKEFIRLLHISLGSQQELETQFIIAKNLNYIIEAIFQETRAENAIVGRMLSGLIKAVKLKVEETA